MVRAWLIGLALFAAAANATDWVEVGADTEAKYYVDVDSISVDGENVSVRKRDPNGGVRNLMIAPGTWPGTRPGAWPGSCRRGTHRVRQRSGRKRRRRISP